MTVGFVGLGIMGSRMARNLLRGGNRLVVFNRSAREVGDPGGRRGARRLHPGRSGNRKRVLYGFLAVFHFQRIHKPIIFG